MKLSIGTAQFGFKYGICNKLGIVKKNEIKKIINFCKLKKIKSIDTAQGYGRSQRVLGKFNLREFELTTKISNIPEHNNINLEKKINSEINKILKELNVKQVYALLIHNTDKLKGKFGKSLFEILLKIKKKNKIKKLGVSVYHKNELNFIIKNYNIDIVSLPVSIANQQFITDNYLSKINKRNIEIHARSIFLQGLLVSNFNDLPKKFKNNKFFLEWFSWLKKNNYDPLEASIAFIKRIKYLDKIVIGVDSLDQLKMIVKIYKKNMKIKFIKFYQSKILSNPSKW